MMVFVASHMTKDLKRNMHYGHLQYRISEFYL